MAFHTGQWPIWYFTGTINANPDHRAFAAPVPPFGMVFEVYA